MRNKARLMTKEERIACLDEEQRKIFDGLVKKLLKSGVSKDQAEYRSLHYLKSNQSGTIPSEEQHTTTSATHFGKCWNYETYRIRTSRIGWIVESRSKIFGQGNGIWILVHYGLYSYGPEADLNVQHDLRLTVGELISRAAFEEWESTETLREGKPVQNNKQLELYPDSRCYWSQNVMPTYYKPPLSQL